MELYKHINFLIKFILLIYILYVIVKINNLLYKDVFFRNYLKSIEIKNNEFEKQNLTSKYVKKIINKNKFSYNIISNKKVSVNITESNLTKIIDSFENLNIYNTTEQNVQTFNFVKTPKISIIIPIYNSQFYILPIIKSIQAQSLKDIEMIFVDDCSLDNSTHIIENLQNKDKRIILLKNKKNKGPFYSRNEAGLFAKGEYIQFIDSDDILINNILEKAFLIAKMSNIDIIQYKFIKKKTNFKVFEEATNFKVINQPELSDQMYYGKGKLKQVNYYIFNKIIRKKTFLDALLFFGDDILKIKLYMNEDLIQLFSLLRVANSLLFINDIGYLKMEDMNYNSLFASSHKNPKSANRIFHDNIVEIRFLFNKSQNNRKDKSIILDFLKMSNKNYGAIAKYITIGFDFFEETFNLILNCSYYDKKQIDKIKKYKNNLMINRNYTIKELRL
jgi:glycosyltransferase involved in cell wall biosynthesis